MSPQARLHPSKDDRKAVFSTTCTDVPPPIEEGFQGSFPSVFGTKRQASSSDDEPLNLSLETAEQQVKAQEDQFDILCDQVRDVKRFLEVNKKEKEEADKKLEGLREEQEKAFHLLKGTKAHVKSLKTAAPQRSVKRLKLSTNQEIAAQPNRLPESSLSLQPKSSPLPATPNSDPRNVFARNPFNITPQRLNQFQEAPQLSLEESSKTWESMTPAEREEIYVPDCLHMSSAEILALPPQTHLQWIAQGERQRRRFLGPREDEPASKPDQKM